MKEYKISEEFLNKLIQYLASKTYSETFNLIHEIQSFKPIENKATKEK